MLPIPSGAAISTGRVLWTVLLAVVPAAVSWWMARRLTHKGDDPALPELLDSRRRSTIRAVAVAAALMIVFAGADAAWGIPLLVVLLIVAAYPLRTRLLGETWGFAPYLWHTALSVIGGFGFWIALAYAPWLVQWTLRVLGKEHWWAATAVAILLLAWEAWYPRIWLWAHAAKPLARPDLTPRFDGIVQRAATIVPAVYSVGPKGSRFVNAVALPSVRRPAIAMGDALLDLLEPDENAAIFAHEMAHFDHLGPRWIRRSQIVSRLLILVGVALPIVAAFRAPTLAPWIGWLWPIAILFALAQRASKSQQHETESDLRAAALCGDPEALVRALAKLHLHARIPRRWAVDVERVASHPSLVRRIQAIRAGGAAAAEQLGAATIVPSTRPGSWVVFDDARAYWLDGVDASAPAELGALRDAASSYRAVNYQDLAELRVSAVGEERRLHARTRAGEAWVVPIASNDVGRVQRTLDIVDLRLGHASSVPAPGATRFLGTMALAVAILAGQTGIVLVPAAIALWKPSPAALAALGAMSLVRAAVGAIERNYWLSAEVFGLATLALALVGVVSIVTAIRQVRAGVPSSDWRWTIGILAAAAAITAVAAVSSIMEVGVTSAVGLPLIGTLGTALFGVAAVLLTGSSRAGRRSGYGTLVAAGVLVVLGVDWASFSLRSALAETTARATPAGESDLGSGASGLRVSPNGERFLALRLPAGRRAATRQTLALMVGRVGGATREVSAIAGEFVDDDRLLLVDVLDQGLELRLERADTAGPPLWADTLADLNLEDPRVFIDRDASTWSIVGLPADSDATMLVTGRIGERETARRVVLPDTLPMMGEPLVFGTTNVVAPVFASVRQRGSSVVALALFGMPSSLRTELWRLTTTGSHRIASLRGVPQCGEPLDGAAACVVRQVGTMALYTVTAEGVATEVAHVSSGDMGVMAAGPGLRAAAMTFDRSMVLVDLVARRLTRVPLPAGREYASEIRSGPGYVITLSYGENGRSKVRKYRVQ